MIVYQLATAMIPRMNCSADMLRVCVAEGVERGNLEQATFYGIVLT